MKKIFALFLCAMLICATPFVAFAEGEETATEVTENTTEVEIAPESEISAEETPPDKIIDFIKENYEGSSFLSLAVTIIVYTYFAVKKHKNLSGSIGVLNNNAVTLAENSAKAIDEAMARAGNIAENSGVIVQNVLAETAAIAEVVKGYKVELMEALAEIRKNAEEKQRLEETLLSVQKTLETLKMADLEFGNEVAELLVLANIPNAKKEELYSRHRAAVNAIETAGKTEVTTNDGKDS